MVVFYFVTYCVFGLVIVVKAASVLSYAPAFLNENVYYRSLLSNLNIPNLPNVNCIFYT